MICAEAFEPRVIDEAVSPVDVLPTVAGLPGHEYTNRTMGRDIQGSTEGRERAVPLVRWKALFPLSGQ
jgi:arylsulfatase A-like enzyme